MDNYDFLHNEWFYAKPLIRDKYKKYLLATRLGVMLVSDLFEYLLKSD